MFVRFGPNFFGIFPKCSNFPELSEAFRRYQGGIQGSVPVPADAAGAQMFPFLAHAAPLGRKPAARLATCTGEAKQRRGRVRHVVLREEFADRGADGCHLPLEGTRRTSEIVYF